MRTIVSFARALTVLLLGLFGCAQSCPYVRGGAACPLVVGREQARVVEIDAAPAPPVSAPLIPSFFRPPDAAIEAGTEWFRGGALAAVAPARLTTAGCVSCDCSQRGRLEPYDDWRAVNIASYARLRETDAPYAIAVVPGYGAATDMGLKVTTLRVQAALRLLQQGWVAALMLSGGHQRGGFHEGRFMARIAAELGKELGIDVENRLFIEPCACHTTTNARNSLQMIEAMGLREALLVSEGDSIPHQALWLDQMDAHAAKHLGCYVGRFALLRGSSSSLGVPLTRFKCARASKRDEPGCAGHGPASVFWISPGGSLPDGRRATAQSCPAGSRDVASCEPVGGRGCARYRGGVAADPRARDLHARRIGLEEELAAFDPRFDCPKQGARLPDALFANAPSELRSEYETMCLRELPEHQASLWFWRRRLGSFAVAGTQLGGIDKGVASDLGFRAELFYRVHWRAAEVTRWRHELGVFSTFMVAGDWLTTTDATGRQLELGPAFETGAWFRPRFADAPLPMALLSLGYALPARAGESVAPTGWIGASMPSLLGWVSVAPTLRVTRELSSEREHAVGFQFLLELGIRK